jgi:transcriptional regulator of NAD metabolism
VDQAQRRKALLRDLQKTDHPLSASWLASRYSVSRQVIVGDVAVLRASGENITATPRGYVMAVPAVGRYIGSVVCRHSMEGMRRELEILVDAGCTVLDVVVDHPVYGQLTGPLQISTRKDVDLFMERISENNTQPLFSLTDGTHVHTLSCPDPDSYRRACDTLEAAGILCRTEDF